MSSVRLRPVFLVSTERNASDIRNRIQSMVERESALLVAQFTDFHAIISFQESKRHFWSPWLNLALNKTATGCEISGRFSPHPSIWTGFAFGYLALSVLIFFSVLVGVAQCLSGQGLLGFFLVPVWIVIGVALWIASQVGQRLAADEMEHLETLVRSAIEAS